MINLRFPYQLSLFTLLAILLSAPGLHASVIDEYKYDFKDDEQLDRYRTLADELRCPKCQNQNLAESNAPIANDLRKVVYKKLQDGLSDEEIKTYLVDRYGDFVLYEPRLKASTIFLWASPVLLFFIGVYVVIRLVKRDNAADPALTADEREKKMAAAKLLAEQSHPKSSHNKKSED